MCLPWESLTEKGATFTFSLLKQLCLLLGIWQVFKSIYHLQTYGMVERMNQTLKDLCKTAGAFPSQWDKFLDPFLFTLQDATGFYWSCPF